jgi:hypothetical protein
MRQGESVAVTSGGGAGSLERVPSAGSFFERGGDALRF